MNQIQTAYINALLADAAYVERVAAGEVLASQFQERLTATQAAYLAANFTVVTSLETPNTINSALGTGFDAVVWQIKAGSELAGPNNVNAGQLFVSMRGTQGLTDIADDGTLATRGIPYDQIRDMVNWWLKNTAAVTNTEVKQIKVTEAPGLIGAKTFALDTPTTGTGVLNELDGIAGVNGHSLGGYLATAFTRIFGSAWGVEQVSTFNSAGFSGAAGLNIASEYDNIAALLGGNMGMAFNSVGTIQNNFLGANGVNFTTNSAADIGLPGFNQYGLRVGLYQEDLLTGSTAPINNHSMYKLTDYLALGAALEKLDTSLSFDKLNELVKAGSSDMKASYEGVLDAMRKLIGGAGVAPLPADDVSDNAATREGFHAALKALQDNAGFQSLTGQVTLNTDLSNIATQAEARLGFEEIAALETLSPFVLNGVGAEGKSALEAMWISAAWAEKYNGWLSDKASLLSQGAPASYTDSWIADRASLLQGLIIRNTYDLASTIALKGTASASYTYTDFASGQTVQFRGKAPNAYTQEAQQVMFGNDLDNGLIGSDAVSAGNGDRLYGGAGNDYLDAKSGNDYLEGNAGNDTLLDAGGQGTIQINTDVLNGGIKLTGTIWESADKKYIYVRVGADLIIGQRTTTTGQFSIGTSGTTSQFINADSWGQQISTGGGNDLIMAGQWELPAGATDADIVSSGAGSDMVFTGQGADIIDAGDGDDFIMSGGLAGVLSLESDNPASQAPAGVAWVHAGHYVDISSGTDAEVGMSTTTAGNGTPVAISSMPFYAVPTRAQDRLGTQKEAVNGSVWRSAA